uniref:Uncharacterized protein n=1 Tax=Siphoviridae sp. ctWhx86 TaxID=2826362 RepID=A0A8S5QNN6_9CAUD|nr:MAG TPA: hypothetical protein [Siphoviridae sp. ctWhx86]
MDDLGQGLESGASSTSRRHKIVQSVYLLDVEL